MKNPKKPTRLQRDILKHNGFKENEWLIIKSTSTEIEIIKKEDYINKNNNIQKINI